MLVDHFGIGNFIIRILNAESIVFGYNYRIQGYFFSVLSPNSRFKRRDAFLGFEVECLAVIGKNFISPMVVNLIATIGVFF
jgi:hypothetical protein